MEARALALSSPLHDGSSESVTILIHLVDIHFTAVNPSDLLAQDSLLGADACFSPAFVSGAVRVPHFQIDLDNPIHKEGGLSGLLVLGDLQLLIDDGVVELFLYVFRGDLVESMEVHVYLML